MNKPNKLRIGLRIFWIVSLSCFFYVPAADAQTGEAIWISFFQNKDIDQALNEFSEVLKEDDEDSMAHAGLGLLGPSRDNQADEAIDHLLQALETGYIQPQATLFLYEALRMIKGQEDFNFFDRFIEQFLQKDDIPDHLRASLQFHQAQMKQRLGEWEKAEQIFSQLNFITDFWICGPFDNSEKAGHNREYGPEENLDLRSSYSGRRGSVQWRLMPLNPYDGYINCHSLIDPSVESTTYLAATLHSETEQRCQLTFGHAGALKVWLNGQLEADMDRYHGPLIDQVIVDTRLQKGNNTLLVKLSSGEKGKYGLYARLIARNPDQVHVIDPHEENELPNTGIHTPKPDQESPPHFQLEPIPVRQLKALGEGPGAEPYHHLFYALLLQRLDIADENDQSANSMLSKLAQLYPANPYLLRQMGESEKQENLRRLAYTRVLELDEDERIAFLLLLDYYRTAPYATKGFELIREWDKNHDVPAKARLIQAQMWNGEGLREAAVDLIRSISGEMGIEGKWTLYEIGHSLMTDEQQEFLLKEILQENANHGNALQALRRFMLRKGKHEQHQQLLDHEKKIDPLSISGSIEYAKYLQTEKQYQKSLDVLDRVFNICPDHFEAHTLSAISYHALGDDQKAMEELEAALVTRPSNPWCLQYGEFLQPEEKDYASPYLKDWQEIEIPESFDLSKANYVNLLNQQIVKVHQNGNSSETVRMVIKVLTDTGIRMQRARGIYYDAGTSEEVRIIRARVWKEDGTFYDAPAVERRSAASSSDAANRLYDDYYVAILQFPALEKGSIIELEYKKEQKGENIYADYFGDLFYIGDTTYEPTIESEYVLITPQSREFYWKYTEAHYPESVSSKDITLDREPEITETEEEKTYHWKFAQLPAIPREPYMPYPSEVLPYIKVSTFQTWSDMTEWYWNLIREQLIPGVVLKQRVKQIVEDYKKSNDIDMDEELSPWQKVRAVNSFVNTEVRYLGLEFGVHGYKPHKVDEICNAQYGDCKDKAALAVTMLKELGIEAYIVIIRTTSKGEIDYELPSLGIFNHAIYYIPDLEGKEYWIDGTATFHDAKELPAMDAGANTLIVKPEGEYEFKRIPHSEAKDNGGLYTTVLTLDENGNAKGIRQAEYKGLYNPIIRQTYENPAKAKEIVDRTLVNRYPGAQSMNIELSDVKDYSTPEHLSYELTIPQFASKQGEQWVIPATLYEEKISQHYARLSKREFDLVLHYPWENTNALSITFPETPENLVLPVDREVESEFGLYKRTIQQEANRVIIRETLMFQPIRVPKEKYQDFREFCRMIDLYQEEKMYVDRNESEG